MSRALLLQVLVLVACVLAPAVLFLGFSLATLAQSLWPLPITVLCWVLVLAVLGFSAESAL